MIVVITRREEGWFWHEPDCELGLNTEFSFWQQVFMSYDVDRFIFVPTTEDGNEHESYDSLEDALDQVTGTHVFLEPPHRAVEIERDPIFLNDFQHPQDAVYIFGRTGWSNISLVGSEDIVLSVEQSNTEGDMFAMTMLAVVLHDRWVKEQ